MSYLLDTHTLIWAIAEPQKLSPLARTLIESPEERILVSTVSFWEISLKHSLGKLILTNISPEDFPDLCDKMGIEMLPLEAATCANYHKISAFHHKDPFDRMLVWLAKQSGFPIISKDATVKLYESIGIKVVW